jgi:molybdopterin-biosynthesis enzyme MoeA-like protein
MTTTATGLIVGNEVLSGMVGDMNGPYLIRRLRARGIDLRALRVEPDEVECIAEAAEALRARGDLLVTSGGLGPTHDDVTVAGIARALARPVVRDAAMDALLRQHLGDQITPEALRLADVPAGASFVPVPGTWLPVLTVENVVLLPGIPRLFQLQLDGILDRHGATAPFALREVFLSVREHVIAGVLAIVAARFPDVRIGSYPASHEAHEVKLTLESRDPLRVEDALGALLRELPEGCVQRVQ